MSKNTNEAADLARIILDDSEADLPNDLYPLNVREARTLARTVLRMEALAEMLERGSGILRDQGDYPNESGAMAARLRVILNGETRG